MGGVNERPDRNEGDVMTTKAAAELSGKRAFNHEIVNSLTSLKSLSELLVDYPGLDRGERIQFLTIIQKETERLVRLYEGLQRDPGTLVSAQ
jgi:signal transduction histidine kinase